MGWAGPFVGVATGREFGYAVEAECDEEGCSTAIDRGLAYVCGGMHQPDPEDGCGGYFCYSHLFIGYGTQKCRRCQAQAVHASALVVRKGAST